MYVSGCLDGYIYKEKLRAGKGDAIWIFSLHPCVAFVKGGGEEKKKRGGKEKEKKGGEEKKKGGSKTRKKGGAKKKKKGGKWDLEKGDTVWVLALHHGVDLGL
jgi:hypothetical protein